MPRLPILLGTLATLCEASTVIRRDVAQPAAQPSAAISRRDLMCAVGLASGCLVSYDAPAVGQALHPGAWQHLDAASRAASVFCHGPLLDAVQRAGLFGDSKVFVDSPLKYDPEEVLRRFEKLPADASAAVLQKFVHEHFERPGADLVPWAPVDFNESPPALAHLQDESLREWAHSLNRFWSQLGRATSAEAASTPERRTLLSLPHPFIVPGGRFVETYYWGTRIHTHSPSCRLNRLGFIFYSLARTTHATLTPSPPPSPFLSIAQTRTGSSRASSPATCATPPRGWSTT